MDYVQPKVCQLSLTATPLVNMLKAGDQHQSRFPYGFSERNQQSLHGCRASTIKLEVRDLSLMAAFEADEIRQPSLLALLKLQVCHS